jgi:hypothetical protein
MKASIGANWANLPMMIEQTVTPMGHGSIAAPFGTARQGAWLKTIPEPCRGSIRSARS